nr:PREDICTED: uncharacterized protein LOC102354024 [Latimeria chalumnae]|eukprot:XP_006009572.2 PREDICTED: uncharacterized protein LOC102354024 [Latimeria chalumnae]
MQTPLTLITWLGFLQSLCFYEGLSFVIKSVQLQKCIQSHHKNSKLSLAECDPHAHHQQWNWDLSTQALVSVASRQCVTVHKVHEPGSVRLEVCGNGRKQAWACSKKGHLSLRGLRLHLCAKHSTDKVIVSKEKGKFSKWVTLTDETVCTRDAQQRKKQHEGLHDALAPPTFSSKTMTNAISATEETKSRLLGAKPSSFDRASHSNASSSAKSASTESLIDDGTSWKVAMLVLSSLALILGITILALNIHYNRKRKLLSDLKGYQQVATWGTSPNLPKEQTPFNAPPSSSGSQSSHSPSLRRGEILIEWKDGTVTPLYDIPDEQS